MDGGGEQVTTPKALAASDRSITFALTEPIDEAFLAASTRDDDVGVEYAIANATKPGTSTAVKQSASLTFLFIGTVFMVLV